MEIEVVVVLVLGVGVEVGVVIEVGLVIGVVVLLLSVNVVVADMVDGVSLRGISRVCGVANERSTLVSHPLGNRPQDQCTVLC